MTHCLWVVAEHEHKTVRTSTLFWHTMEELVCTVYSCLHRVHLVRVIADDVVHDLRGTFLCLFNFPRLLRCLRHLELPRVRRRHARQRDNREFKHLRKTGCQWNRAFDSTYSSIDHRIWCLITQRSVDDIYLQRSRSTNRDIDRAS